MLKKSQPNPKQCSILCVLGPPKAPQRPDPRQKVNVWIVFVILSPALVQILACQCRACGPDLAFKFQSIFFQPNNYLNNSYVGSQTLL